MNGRVRLLLLSWLGAACCTACLAGLDAWNRLVQVNGAGTLTPDSFLPNGQFDPDDPNDPNGVPGDTRLQLVYDGLGRLIRQKQSLPDDQRPRTTHFYYDGVRRIHETYAQLFGPIGGFLSMLFGLDGGDAEGNLVAFETEYIWGPDYVDELAFFINSNGYARYVLLDANYNVMGVAKPNGAVVAQWAYGPYGDVRAADWQNPNTPTPLACGHQGLFFIRLDGSVTDPPLELGGVTLGYNRNRILLPPLGRFAQRDVNETALPILTAYAFNGSTLDLLLGAFDGQALYGDGMNLYAYLGANPVNLTDALGLTYDDSWLDEFIDDYTGHRLYALGTINEYAGYASIGLQTALGIASSLLGVDVFTSVAVLASGQGGFWEAMDIVASVTPIGRVTHAISRMTKFARLAQKTSKWVGKLIGHHTVPTAVLKKLNPAVRSKGPVRGMAGQRNIWEIPEDLHKYLHGGGPRGGRWNEAWWRELGGEEGAANATVEKVVEIRERLVRQFGLEEYRP